ncbi:hypothetical protein BT96DRAFT_943950 [Gymnopus androsaceus JB14]|uniref:Ribonuclease H1 N-terminal domain-containing protein n=1 Tax=Gymnopus androsaceus JB14 TaxID=1447944 RepID=A0A6A4H599_9AGAR|nr:hypothetical protein BT96DRAFT_943950 [Gymnopus androsaceus JB14]
MVQNNELSAFDPEFSTHELHDLLNPDQLRAIRLRKAAAMQRPASKSVAAAPSNSNFTAANPNPVPTPGTASSDSSCVICSTCGALNALPTNDTHYTITIGKSVGVFSDLAFVQAQVMGVSGACFKRYSTQAAALQAYHQAVVQGVVRIVTV